MDALSSADMERSLRHVKGFSLGSPPRSFDTKITPVKRPCASINHVRGAQTAASPWLLHVASLPSIRQLPNNLSTHTPSYHTPPSPLAVLSSYILFFDSFCFSFYLSVVLLPLERSAVVSVRTPSAMRSTRCVIIICKMFLCRRGAHPSNRH